MSCLLFHILWPLLPTANSCDAFEGQLAYACSMPTPRPTVQTRLIGCSPHQHSYEVFKQKYAHVAGENTFTFLAASASAEFFADIGWVASDSAAAHTTWQAQAWRQDCAGLCACRLCAFEATKVKVQTVPGALSGPTATFLQDDTGCHDLIAGPQPAGFGVGLMDSAPKIVRQEGVYG